MRARLHIHYTVGGVTHAPGDIVELDADELARLGADAEVLGDAASGRDQAPLEPAFEDVVKARFQEITGRLQTLDERLQAIDGRGARIERAVHDMRMTREGEGGESLRREPPAGGDGTGDGEPAKQGVDPPPAPSAGGGEPPSRDATGPVAVEAVMRAMHATDPDRARAKWWIRSGAPATDELARRGLALTAPERDAAWARVSASLAGTADPPDA